jgi:dGTPase
LITPRDLDQLDIWRLLCERMNWQGGELDEITLHAFIRELIGVLVDDMLTTTEARLEKLHPKSSEDIQRQTENVVGFSENMARMNKALKRFLYDNVYYSFRVVRMKTRAQRFLREIFNTLLEDPRQLPKECQAEIPEHSKERVITDYIASMTDRSAVLEYRRLFDPLMRP